MVIWYWWFVSNLYFIPFFFCSSSAFGLPLLPLLLWELTMLIDSDPSAGDIGSVPVPGSVGLGRQRDVGEDEAARHRQEASPQKRERQMARVAWPCCLFICRVSCVANRGVLFASELCIISILVNSTHLRLAMQLRFGMPSCVLSIADRKMFFEARQDVYLVLIYTSVCT